MVNYDGILEHLDLVRGSLIRLVDINKTYDIVEFCRLLCDDDLALNLQKRGCFKIVSHLYEVPETVSSELSVLIVGSCGECQESFISGNLTFSGILGQIVELVGIYKGTYVLLVDTPEVLSLVDEFDNIVCGFKVLHEGIEIFDKYSAVEYFCGALK